MSRLKRDRVARLSVSIPDRYPHVGIFSPSGGGKTTCFAVPTLLERSENMVILDSKGELCRLTARHRNTAFGHEIIVIDPFGVAAGCGFEPARFNPLDLCRRDPQRILDEARRIAASLVIISGKENDVFWPQYARQILTGTLAFLMSEAREGSSLNHMRDIISSPKLMTDMINFMLESQSCGGLLARLAGQLLQIEGQAKASAYSVANSHIEWLDSIPLTECLAQSTFDPDQLLHGKMSIYLCLPIDRITELSGLQRVYLSCLIHHVFAAGEDPHRRIRFLLDESATLGPMDALYNAVFFGRSYGLRLMFLFQSTAQVERCFPESQRDDFFATVATVYSAINDYRTAKDVSDWMGQGTILSRSEQRGSNWGNSASSGVGDQSKGVNWGSNNSTSYNEIARPLLRPEEVLQLGRQFSIVLLPGLRPVLTEKMPYYLQPKASGFIGQGLALMCSLFLIAFSAVLITLFLWLITAGQVNPLVRDFWQHMGREYGYNIHYGH